MSQYPEKESNVTVTFLDGEVKVYRITASPAIARYLNYEAGRSGIMSFWNKTDNMNWSIPVSAIREWCITEVVE